MFIFDILSKLDGALDTVERKFRRVFYVTILSKIFTNLSILNTFCIVVARITLVIAFSLIPLSIIFFNSKIIIFSGMLFDFVGIMYLFHQTILNLVRERSLQRYEEADWHTKPKEYCPPGILISDPALFGHDPVESHLEDLSNTYYYSFHGIFLVFIGLVLQLIGTGIQ